MTRGPPLEVTRDLPRSYQAKLLNKYTQTPGSGQQRQIAVSDPSADVISERDLVARSSCVNFISAFQMCVIVSKRSFYSAVICD